MPTLREYLANFAPQACLPVLLLKLLDFQNRHHEVLSGADIALTAHGRQRLQSWCHGNPVALACFSVFACRGQGSLYAFWSYDERELPQAPIVLLGSASGESRILADSLTGFACMLAAGWDPLESEAPAAGSDQLRRFRAWLEQETGLVVPAHWRELAVGPGHPDLQAWLEQHHC